MSDFLTKVGLSIDDNRKKATPCVNLKIGAWFSPDARAYQDNWFYADRHNDVERLCNLTHVLKTGQGCSRGPAACDGTTKCANCPYCKNLAEEFGYDNYDLFDVLEYCGVCLPSLSRGDCLELWVEEFVYYDEHDCRFNLHCHGNARFGISDVRDLT